MSRRTAQRRRFAFLVLVASCSAACARDWDAFTRLDTGAGGAAASASEAASGLAGASTSVASSVEASTASTGGPPPMDIGCSDGTREAYVDLVKEPAIAGCAGGFQIAGVTTPPSKMPQCNRVAGNDSANANGTGCSVEDLCAAGWHVCNDAKDVASSASTGQCDPPSGPPVFWLTRQAQNGGGMCGGGPDNNNVVGCGSLGETPPGNAQCAPLIRYMRSTDCMMSATWSCGNQTPTLNEADIVEHKGPSEGGVLCCKG